MVALVDIIRDLSPAGGFVKFCNKKMCYVEIGDRGARQKVAHALRNAMLEESSKKRRSSILDKRRKKSLTLKADESCRSEDSKLFASGTHSKNHQQPPATNLLDMFATERLRGTTTRIAASRSIISVETDSEDFGAGELERLLSSSSESEKTLYEQTVEQPPDDSSMTSSSSSSTNSISSSLLDSESLLMDLVEATTFSSTSTLKDLDIDSIF